MLTQAERPLSEEERSKLGARLSDARAESWRALVKAGLSGAVVCGVLAVLTLLASDAPRPLVVAFWLALWLLFTFWVGLPWRKQMLEQVRFFEEALRTNRVREIRLQASRVVEFEEEEDEGACYAFDQDGNSAVFVVGQEFYEDDDFPNSDFSVLEFLGDRGQAVDVEIVKRGRKLMPERVIPATVKNQLELPEHLTVVPSALDRIEMALPRRVS